MTRKSQKDEEIAVTRFYLDKASISAEIVDAGEPPDIIIQCGDQRIGIELTSYTQPHREGERSLRQTEAAWQELLKFVRQVRGEYADLAGMSIWLKFVDGLMPRRKDFPYIVDEMAQFIRRETPRCNAKGYARPSAKYPTLYKLVELVRMHHVGCYMDWSYSGHAGFIGSNDQDIYPIVRKKNEIFVTHRISELWLIIYGGHTISRMLDFYDNDMSDFTGTASALEAGPFDRLILVGSGDIRTLDDAGEWQRIPLT